MKPLSNYLAEALEIEKTNGSYRTVVLLRHEGIETGKLTKEEFIELMKADLKKATSDYLKAIRGDQERNKHDYMDRRRKEAEEFASKKWKTDAKRQQYIDNAMTNAESLYKDMDGSIFFDFKPDVGLGLPGVCILDDSTPDSQLGMCFDKLAETKWWQYGTGWAFKYECHTNSLISSFRPWIDLLMDESHTAERRRDQEHLDKAVSDYYAKATYTGD